MSYTTRIIAVFCLGWAIIYADRTALFPLLPAISGELGLSAVQAGAIASAYFLAYISVQPLAGVIGDRLGLKQVLVAMVLLAGLGLAGLALLARDYAPLIVLIAIHGAGAGVYYPMAYSIALYAVPAAKRGLSSAIIGAGMSLGLALGLAASGPLYLAVGTWRAPYLVMAVPTLAAALIFWLAVRPIAPRPQSAGGTRKALLDPTVLSLNAMTFCSLYGFWSVISWGPTYFQTERGLGLGVAGGYAALVAVAAIPAALLTGRFSDRIGRRRLALILLPLGAGAIALVAGAGSPEVLMLALVAYGLTGKLALDPVSVSWVADRVSSTRPQAMGAVMGMFSFSGMSSAVVAPLVAGWIKDSTGSLQGALYLAAGVVLAGMVFAALAGESRPSDIGQCYIGANC